MCLWVHKLCCDYKFRNLKRIFCQNFIFLSIHGRFLLNHHLSIPVSILISWNIYDRILNFGDIWQIWQFPAKPKQAPLLISTYENAACNKNSKATELKQLVLDYFNCTELNNLIERELLLLHAKHCLNALNDICYK